MFNRNKSLSIHIKSICRIDIFYHSLVAKITDRVIPYSLFKCLF